ncbi:class I SAM-dependent methyltransferase [Halothiobacillus sp. DCM-1]|uniref:class I SAM-dependent methyltransferase n=1 Tax=Halothiobacillus sp. DCM-1 TaxID=3112558 RepID=UPI00324F3620
MQAVPDFSLPVPDAEDREKSSALIRRLKERLQQAPISFETYMAEVLYHPQWGYYGSGQVQFGAVGDFVTAPERSPLFAAGLVYEWQQIARQHPQAAVCEIGAGSGRLAIDFLTTSAARGCIPARYLIVEISPALQKRQQAQLRAALPEALWQRVEWVDTLAVRPSVWPGGMLIANEVLDAMPVQRFRWIPGQANTACLMGVGLQGERFGWVPLGTQPELTAALTVYEQAWPVDSLPDTPIWAEINLGLADWLAAWYSALAAPAETRLYLLDYGAAARELYRPDRQEGTLRCHYRHRAHDDPFVYPGLQDITSWVDFTRAASLAETAGFVVDGERSQASWLLGTDVPDRFTEMMDAAKDRRQAAALAQGFKELVLPTEMGERFRVLRLTRPATL